jgi:hypothetical protein
MVWYVERVGSQQRAVIVAPTEAEAADVAAADFGPGRYSVERLATWSSERDRWPAHAFVLATG